MVFRYYQRFCRHYSKHYDIVDIPLFFTFSCSAQCVIVVQLLLSHGADPNQRDSLGNTPLHLGKEVQ